MSGKAISSYFNAPQSTIHRILQQLVKMGYVEQGAESKEYIAGMKLFSFAQRVTMLERPLIQHIEPLLSQLHAELNENIFFTVYSSTAPRVVYRLKSTLPIGINAEPPEGRNFHASSTGKLFLAYTSPHVRESYLKQGLSKFTDNTITSPVLLQKELARVKEVGFAVDNEEHWQGVTCVSVLIKGNGKPFGEISLQVPTSRYTHYDDQWWVSAVKKTALEIARVMTNEAGKTY